ncbi:FHA domain containing protein [Calothrix sp. NIES-2100]|uniref:nitric oxide synthase oxygenase n=1 Tax=Calothrix sp. NIES-2100 TaxID=1954172 RepID=UPI000B5DC458|nr:FHA domain containing protein [Calothrix sp. NIES-2100]
MNTKQLGEISASSTATILVFTSDFHYLPAKEFVSWVTTTDRSEVYGFKRLGAFAQRAEGIATSTSLVSGEWFNLNLNSQKILPEEFDGAEAAVIFIMPTDLSEVVSLTRSLIDIAQKQGIRRLAWVAPACPSGQVGERLAEAESLVRGLNIETLILRHAPLFSQMLGQKKELRFRRTLSLPLGTSSLPWLEPEAIAFGLSKWLHGEINNQPPEILTGLSQLSGADIASEISAILRQSLSAQQFARLRFDAIDLDQSGHIDAQELLPYLLDLGYSHDECQSILEQADTDGSGTIDFDEFVYGLEAHLNRILADVPTEVRYFDVPASAALHDAMALGMNGKAAQSQLDWLVALSESGLSNQAEASAQWLGRKTLDLRHWIAQHILELINVYILPGRGILTISEGFVAEKPGIITRLLQANDRLLIGERSLDGEILEWYWADEDSNNLEEVRYTPENGGERILRLKDGKIASLSVRGRWSGRRLAIQLFFEDRLLPRWQVALFRELGELQIEEVTTSGADSDIVCNCTKTTCGKVRELIDTGLDSLEGIVEQTQVTMICGSCQPLVEEMLGSANLAVAELVNKEDLGRGMMRFQFCPVYEQVVASKPGQHLLIQGRVDGSWVTRAYTLSSPADQTEQYEITVKREELGLFSRWLCDRADSEALLRISAPRGEFFLEDENPVIFFAGGIGITPAIAMMRTLANRGDTRKFHLDFSAPHAEDLVFLTELGQLVTTHPNLSFTVRATRRTGRLTLEDVQNLYPYTEETVAFMCGPEPFMDGVRSYLKTAGWPDCAIRQELFSSKLNEEGNVQTAIPQRPAVQLAGGITPIEQMSIYVQPINSVAQEAEVFLKQCYLEQGLAEVFLPRWQEVKESIELTGTYEHTLDELVYGTKLAWRNSNRCLGRNFWRSLQLRDMRHLQTEEEIFQTLVEHIKFATNNGNLRSTITILNPNLNIKVWNNLMLRYAGYRQPDGSILGDPANVELTDQAIKLGWTRESKTRFDVLPLIIQVGEGEPKLFEIPPEIILEVPISHPRYEWFADLDLKWFGLPAVANMMLDMGGIQYPTPFNGFYMGAEIGGRNFSDTYRYNMLPIIAEKMGLDSSENITLWKDLALVEMNVAVLHSYKLHGVRMLDHHTLTDSFMQFVDEEQKCDRHVYGDWRWLLPPLSGSTTPVYPLEFENRLLKPNYFYVPDPWEKEPSAGKCPFHHQA